VTAGKALAAAGEAAGEQQLDCVVSVSMNELAEGGESRFDSAEDGIFVNSAFFRETQEMYIQSFQLFRLIVKFGGGRNVGRAKRTNFPVMHWESCKSWVEATVKFREKFEG